MIFNCDKYVNIQKKAFNDKSQVNSIKFEMGNSTGNLKPKIFGQFFVFSQKTEKIRTNQAHY